MGTAVGALAFVVLILFAIFFHEFGHFITARWAGIKVSRFFVGFGPTLWSFRRGRTEVVEDADTAQLVERPETEYGIKAFPLGGFVKVVGMSPFEEVAPQDESRAFGAAPVWKRAIVLSAGSVTHLVTAFVILVLVFWLIGLPDFSQPTLQVGSLVTEIEGETAPAHASGVRPGDRIVAVAGEPVETWDELRERVREHPGERITLTVSRAGEELTLPITPAEVTEDGETVGVIGVEPSFAVQRFGPTASVDQTGRYFGAFFTRLPQAREAFTPRNLGLVPGEEPGEDRGFSIYGAGRIAADFVDRGQVGMFLLFFAEINLVFAVLNMLPLPPLDGGHLLVLGIEKVRGKPVSQRALLPVMAIVLSLLVVVAVSLLFQDIVSPVDPFQ